MEKIYRAIEGLVSYAIREDLAEEADRAYLTNSVIAALRLDEFVPVESLEVQSLDVILSTLTDYAYEKGLIENPFSIQLSVYSKATILSAVIAKVPT